MSEIQMRCPFSSNCCAGETPIYREEGKTRYHCIVGPCAYTLQLNSMKKQRELLNSINQKMVEVSDEVAIITTRGIDVYNCS